MRKGTHQTTEAKEKIRASQTGKRRGFYKNSRCGTIPRETLAEVVKNSKSIREIIQKLGLKGSGRLYEVLKATIVKMEIPSEHLVGQAWKRGLPGEKRLPHEQIFVLGRLHKRHVLKRALDEIGRVYECAICKQGPVHMGKELVLPIDHIDGNPWNNLAQNIRFVCPNCHTQTETWGFKNSRRLHKPRKWKITPL